MRGECPLHIIPEADSFQTAGKSILPSNALFKSMMQELCKANNLWLHLEGHALSALTLLPGQSAQTVAQRGDSMTLTFGSWVGIPSVPFVTLYRNDTPAAQIAGMTL